MATKYIQILGGFPQSDWNQNDSTNTEYVKNRTHYTYLEATQIGSGYADSNSQEFTFSVMPEVGDRLIIVVNGVEYNSKWENYYNANIGADFDYAGYNPAHGGDGSIPVSIYKEFGTIYFIYDSTMVSSADVQVYKNMESVYPLDAKFVPYTVQTTEQTLTDEQKAQVRANIGAISSTDVDPIGSAAQTLADANTYTDTAVSQKSQVQIITWEDDD